MFIKGKTALVTGAATSIGLEYVKALLRKEAQVSYIGQHTRSCNSTGLCTSLCKLPFKGKRVFC
jgi:NADP-dependent 3-hydroxy acid dehydrogenase YdfG